MVIYSRPWYFPMNFGIILEVMPSLAGLALLLLLIFVLILEGSLVLRLNLVSLNPIAIDAVGTTIHVANAYHLVKTNKL